MNITTNAVPFPENLEWLNTNEPLTLDKLKGQVVLLDFWTYCCINCIHVLPELKQLEQAFTNQSFVVVGVHSAKFTNEQDPQNISNALMRYNVEHPVVIDNEHQLWQAYGIRAWPSFILIDSTGKVRGKASSEKIFRTIHQATLQLLAEGKKNNTLTTPLTFQPIKKSSGILSFPSKITPDQKNKRLFIADSNHNRILVTQFFDNNLKIIDQIGSSDSGDKIGTWASSQFNQPQGMAYKDDHLYVCDTDNNKIKIVDLNNKSVLNFAGTGIQGDWRVSPDEATKTPLNSPTDCTILEDNLFIAMAGNHQIWKIDLSGKNMAKFAGSGWENLLDGKRETAQFAQPSGIASAPEAIYVADSEASALRKIDLRTNLVRTLIGEGLFSFGSQDGDFAQAQLQHCLGIDYLNNFLIIADTYNHSLRLADLTKNQITTLISRPKQNVCQIGDQNCNILPLNEPNGAIFWDSNTIIIADTNNHLIRKFDLKTKELIDLKIVS